MNRTTLFDVLARSDVTVTAVSAAVRKLREALRQHRSDTREFEVERSLTIARPADELDRLRRESRVLAAVMEPLPEVQATDSGQLRWGDSGTVVRLRVRFEPPGGVVGTAAARRRQSLPRSPQPA